MKISLNLIYNWYRHAIRNPRYRWWIILGTLVYFISPLDISPDLLPIAGQIDDIALLTLLMTEVTQLVFDYFTCGRRNIPPSPTEAANTQTIDVDAVSLD